MFHAELLKTNDTFGSGRCGSSVSTMTKVIPWTYLGMYMAKDKMIPAWVATKTKEITPFIEGSV